MSDLNHNNYAYLYGNTFVDVCEEASRHYRPPYRPIDLMRPPLGQHIYGGHCCCNDYPVRPDPYHKCPADDGTEYDCSCKCGNHGTTPIPPVNRDDIPNIINIETTLKLSLELTLYGVTEKDDKKVILETGKYYTVKYITECGLQIITGLLTIIDSNIPLSPLRYIGEYNNEYVDTCYIGLDCSTVGKSDRRKIFISSIRDIKEYIEEKPSEDDSTTTEPDEDTATEETPKDDSTVTEPPVEDDTTEETPKDDSTTDKDEETPKEDTTTEETPKDDSTVTEPPVEDDTTEETPKEDIVPDGTTIVEERIP